MTLLSRWLPPAQDQRPDDLRKLVQILRFGCSYESIIDCGCSTTTIRYRRDEWIKAGIFAKLKQIALEAYDRIVGLLLQEIAVDGCITKAPGGGECAGRSPVDRGKQGMKRSSMVMVLISVGELVLRPAVSVSVSFADVRRSLRAVAKHRRTG